VKTENLRAFLAVVDEGHYGAAARRLRIPQSTLSRRIQRLESLVGHELLMRTVRPIVPSPAGRIVAESAQAIIGAADRATARLRTLDGGWSGPLRVGYVQSATYGWVPRILRVSRRRHIDVEFVAAPSIRQVEALFEHRLELGLLRPASVGRSSTGLLSVTLARDEIFAVVPRRHRLAAARSLTRSDLAGERLVLYPEREGPGLRRLVDDWFANPRATDGPVEAGGPGGPGADGPPADVPRADGRGADLPGSPVEASGVPRVQDAWDAPSAVVLAAAGAGIAILPGPLPPLPRAVVARPVAKAPAISMALMWHPTHDRLLEPFIKDVHEASG
jgi:DNA-binding transcriptional LysR family regulator